ncbi:MAG: 16S rRNA (cytosine(1402)-N(4))-methyltransferase [Nitratiruptor sp.]|nr:16S rRNA (cytosine(1402)-N(4))-methyltransferase [Nitratiruptor sp.]NPA83284.1 16S rRNA (cytosine(1402)-N(4))-methyltransferase RsmH [Campylobacterota bacterium]
MQRIPHIPVLQEPIVEAFRDSEGYIVDATLGFGGHSQALLEANPKIKIIGIDRDREAIAFAKERLAPFQGRVEILRGTFATQLPKLLETYPIAGVLADIGVSSLQLDKRERGFSFESDLLDMRMDQEAPLSAYEVVNHYDLARLQEVLRRYGEVRGAERIARAIIAHRPIASAKELANLIARLLPKKGKIHPATTIFQAIRIEVNRELEELEGLLKALEEHRPPGAKVAIITFHSLEDRIVKETFRRWARNCICPPETFRCQCQKNHALGTIITKRPIVASSSEVAHNPRSRSAKLRLFQFKETNGTRAR